MNFYVGSIFRENYQIIETANKLTDVLGLHIRKRYLKQVTFLGKLRFGKKVLLYMYLKNSTVSDKLKVCVMVL